TPLRVQGRAQEVGVVHARDLDRVLEGEEQARGGALLRLEGQQVRPFEPHRAGADRVALAPGQHVAERGLAGAVGTHDGVHFAGLHLQGEPLEDLAVVDGRVEVRDIEHGNEGNKGNKGNGKTGQPTAPSRLT